MPWVRELLMRMFGRPKGVLGQLGGVIMARANRDAAAQVVEVLDVRPDDKVLEVGFGPGVAIQMLLHRVPAGSVAGVDQSQEMVRQAAAATPTRCEAAGRTCATVQSKGYRSQTRRSIRRSRSIRCRRGRMRAPDCGRYGACSNMVATSRSASLSTPASQRRALRSRSPLLALRSRESWTSRSSSARSRQGRDVDMPKEVTIKALTAWLRRNGFNELRGKKTGHR